MIIMMTRGFLMIVCRLKAISYFSLLLTLTHTHIYTHTWSRVASHVKPVGVLMTI